MAEKIYPDDIMEMLRCRLGLGRGDDSQDDEIMDMDPREAVEEICRWKFGYPGWFDTFEYWINSVGLEIVGSTTE